MALTMSEKTEFTPGQLEQIGRLSPSRFSALLEPAEAEDRAAARATTLGKWCDLAPSELRCRVNIESIRWGFDRQTGKRFLIMYSPENDYTAAQQQKVANGLRAGDQWLYVIPWLVK